MQKVIERFVLPEIIAVLQVFETGDKCYGFILGNQKSDAKMRNKNVERKHIILKVVCTT